VREILKIAEEKCLKGSGLTYDEGVEFTRIPYPEVFDVLSVSDRIRRRFKGKVINLCSIVNAKSGLCREDCSFCSQSIHHTAAIKTYPMAKPAQIVSAAENAEKIGANEFSIVTSGTGIVKDRDLETLTEALESMEARTGLNRCASLGILKKETLERLKKAGLESYHHNLETSRSFFPNICTTHDYEKDVRTVRTAKELGFHVCSGGIFGLGETWEQRVELAETLRELDVDSVPINFLDPRPGTPLEGERNLTPNKCLMTIALFRFMLPAKDILVCGGREVNLRDLQPLIFAAGANGTMIGNYLTTTGRDPEEDLRMLKDLDLTPQRG
jgi:biotin synthase